MDVFLIAQPDKFTAKRMPTGKVTPQFAILTEFPRMTSVSPWSYDLAV